jgi:hypothetical protein
VLIALGLLEVQGAASFLKNANWPKYETVSADASYANGKLNSKGYGCLRNNFNWAFP